MSGEGEGGTGCCCRLCGAGSVGEVLRSGFGLPEDLSCWAEGWECKARARRSDAVDLVACRRGDVTGGAGGGVGAIVTGEGLEIGGLVAVGDGSGGACLDVGDICSGVSWTRGRDAADAGKAGTASERLGDACGEVDWLRIVVARVTADTDECTPLRLYFDVGTNVFRDMAETIDERADMGVTAGWISSFVTSIVGMV